MFRLCVLVFVEEKSAFKIKMTEVNGFVNNKDDGRQRLAATTIFVGGGGGAVQTEFSEKSRWQMTNNVRTILSVLIGE